MRNQLFWDRSNLKDTRSIPKMNRCLLLSDRSAGYLYNLSNMENDTSNQHRVDPKGQMQLQQA